MKQLATLSIVVFGLLAFGGMARAEEEPTAIPGEGTLRSLLPRLEKGLLRADVGPFSATLHARLQAWGGWVGEDALLENGDRMQEPGFRARRARLGVEGRFTEAVTYQIQLDLVDQERSGGPLYDAWVDYTPIHYIGASVGFQKFLFVQSDILSSARLPHLDRPLGTFALSPNNALGLVLHSSPWKDRLVVSAGVFNGLHRSEAFHSGYDVTGVTLGNRFEDVSFAGRLDLAPLGKMGKGMADPSQTEEVRFAVGGGGFYNAGASIATYGFSAYAHLQAYGAHLFAEYAQDHAEPQEEPTTTSTISAELSRRVLNVSAGYVFLKDLLGLAVRFELLDDNTEKDTQGDEWLLTATLTFYALGDFLKAQVEYTHREELHGLSIDNDWAIAGVQMAF